MKAIARKPFPWLGGDIIPTALVAWVVLWAGACGGEAGGSGTRADGGGGDGNEDARADGAGCVDDADPFENHELQADVALLAADEMMGRKPGSDRTANGHAAERARPPVPGAAERDEGPHARVGRRVPARDGGRDRPDAAG